MKIAILSRNSKLYSTRRFIEACEQRGHEPMVIDALRTYMDVVSSKPEAHFKGEVLPYFDAIIPRIGASVTFYGTAVLRQFESWVLFHLMNLSQSVVHEINYVLYNCFHEKVLVYLILALLTALMM